MQVYQILHKNKPGRAHHMFATEPGAHEDLILVRNQFNQMYMIY